jgi:hypothetical protein
MLSGGKYRRIKTAKSENGSVLLYISGNAVIG